MLLYHVQEEAIRNLCMMRWAPWYTTRLLVNITLKAVVCFVLFFSDLCVSAVPEGKLRMRRKAVAALAAHKQEGLQQLKDDPDEMLRGQSPR